MVSRSQARTQTCMMSDSDMFFSCSWIFLINFFFSNICRVVPLFRKIGGPIYICKGRNQTKRFLDVSRQETPQGQIINLFPASPGFFFIFLSSFPLVGHKCWCAGLCGSVCALRDEMLYDSRSPKDLLRFLRQLIPRCRYVHLARG